MTGLHVAVGANRIRLPQTVLWAEWVWGLIAAAAVELLRVYQLHFLRFYHLVLYVRMHWILKLLGHLVLFFQHSLYKVLMGWKLNGLLVLKLRLLGVALLDFWKHPLIRDYHVLASVMGSLQPRSVGVVVDDSVVRNLWERLFWLDHRHIRRICSSSVCVWCLIRDRPSLNASVVHWIIIGWLWWLLLSKVDTHILDIGSPWHLDSNVRLLKVLDFIVLSALLFAVWMLISLIKIDTSVHLYLLIFLVDKIRSVPLSIIAFVDYRLLWLPLFYF